MRQKRFGLVGWQRAALVVLALLNLGSWYTVRHEHPVWAVAHAVMAAVQFPLSVVTWPGKEEAQ